MTERRRPAPLRWRPKPAETAAATFVAMAAVATLLAVNVARGHDPALARKADRPAAAARVVVVERSAAPPATGTSTRTSTPAPAPPPVATSQS